MMVAAQKGFANSARKLIELGADVNAATVRQTVSYHIYFLLNYSNFLIRMMETRP